MTSQLSHSFIKIWDLWFSQWCEVTILLGYDTVSLGNWFPTFLDSTVVSSSCVSWHHHVQHGWYRLIKICYSHLHLNIIHILTLQTIYIYRCYTRIITWHCSLTVYIQYNLTAFHQNTDIFKLCRISASCYTINEYTISLL
jgi:hypothetical protein